MSMVCFFVRGVEDREEGVARTETFWRFFASVCHRTVTQDRRDWRKWRRGTLGRLWKDRLQAGMIQNTESQPGRGSAFTSLAARHYITCIKPANLAQRLVGRGAFCRARATRIGLSAISPGAEGLCAAWYLSLYVCLSMAPSTPQMSLSTLYRSYSWQSAAWERLRRRHPTLRTAWASLRTVLTPNAE